MADNDGRTAIVLLHGIGDQRQRTTINGFLQALTGTGTAKPPEELTLRQSDAQSNSTNYFVADAFLSGRPIAVAEYFWADISRVRSGFFAIQRNFFQLVVDAPDIVYSCLGPRHSPSGAHDYFALRVYRSLLAIMMWLIYFPIVALNIAYAILAGEFALNAANNPDIRLDTPADQQVAIASVIGIVAFFGLALARNVGNYFRAISTLVIACLLGIGAFALVNTLTAARVFTYGQYAILFNEGLNLLWAIVIAGSLIYLLSIPVLCLFFYRRWRSILLGFTTQFLVVRFWLALITTVWLVYLTSIFDNKTYDSLISEIGGPIRFISLLWFDVAVVGVILISSLAAYLLQTARNRGRKSGQKYPRLIVPSILPFVSIALAIGGVSIIAACNCPLVLEQCEPVTCDLVYEPSEWIIANAATLLAIGGVVIQFAHGRFDVAIDIVNFFKSNRGHRRFNPLSAVASVFRFAPGDSSEFRPQLKRRLDELVDDLIVARGPFKRIIFVGHSLGSMIAIDGLATARGSTAADSVELVTMGSPYRSIFNYYFPHMFPPPSLTGLAGVRSWTNIYRENDFVGTNLDNGSGDIEDIAEPPHGHIGYFSDEAVAKKIALLALMGRTVESAREPATV